MPRYTETQTSSGPSECEVCLKSCEPYHLTYTGHHNYDYKGYEGSQTVRKRYECNQCDDVSQGGVGQEEVHKGMTVKRSDSAPEPDNQERQHLDLGTILSL
ncbi:hypothetical protein U0070_010095 [Myodes glareolus]|uniref:Uncharacterized protein n=1 Tax=Myodes glareolus TaxID=447135 RepID=A0AAW0I4A5_MYOGA